MEYLLQSKIRYGKHWRLDHVTKTAHGPGLKYILYFPTFKFKPKKNMLICICIFICWADFFVPNCILKNTYKKSVESYHYFPSQYPLSLAIVLLLLLVFPNWWKRKISIWLGIQGAVGLVQQLWICFHFESGVSWFEYCAKQLCLFGNDLW